MLCGRCGIRPANVHFTQIIDGKKLTQHLCNICAQEIGLGGEEEFGFTGFFEIPDIFANLFKRRPTDRIYDYFSETSQKVIALAREEAKRLNFSQIKTEHLLLGLIKEEGLAYKILQNLGIDGVTIFSEIESLIGRGEQTTEEISLSPRAKKVLELAFAVAKEMGMNYVGSEHILLGILKEGESLAAQDLKKKSITFDKTLKELAKEIEASGGGEEYSEEEMGPEEMFGMPGGMFGLPATGTKGRGGGLSAFSRDLTQMVKENKLDPVIDRDKEIDRVIRILSRRTKNNPALLGDPGVGKTAIVEGLAERIVKGDVPESIKDKQVVSLDLAGMLAGTKYRGEFEARIKKVLDEIIAKGKKIILFIDELHTLVGAGAAEGAIDAANILKPALARGDLQCVGATTVDEYRKYIEKDAALERRFQPVMVNEPSVELSIEILKGIRDKYEAYHRVKIPDATILACVNLAHRYITDRFLPDKAIDLMDEGAAKVRLRMISPPKELKEINRNLEKLNQEIQAAVNTKKYEKAAELRDKLSTIDKMAKEKEEAWKKERGISTPAVTEEDIAEIVSDWTGIPVLKLTEAETSRLLKMEEVLHEHIVGQEEAVIAISQSIRRGRAGLKVGNRPVGSFVFAGPTGVGKTEVSRRLAEFLFGSSESMIRLDMSEYMEKHTVSRMLGAPPGYVGFEEGGQLTEAVRRKPYSVILFDEVEKAHPDVFNILLQILEDGRLTDSKGRTVDFKNTVIIMTTNIGAKLITSEEPIGFVTKEDREHTYEKMKSTVLEEIKKEFRPEFLNRIDEIIVFHNLTDEQLRQIVDLMLGDVIKALKEKGISIEVENSVKDIIVKEGHDPKFGARPLRRAVEKLIENPLSNEILMGKFKEGDVINVTGKDNKICFNKIAENVLKPEICVEEKKPRGRKAKK